MKQLQKVQYICFAVGSGVWIYGWIQHQFDMLAAGMLLIFIQNLLFAVRKFKHSIVFLMFQGAVFTFLLARPIIGLFENIDWWNVNSQAKESIYATIFMITLSLVALYIGAEIIIRIIEACEKTKKFFLKEKREDIIKALRFISLLAYLFTLLIFFIQEGEKLLFIRNHTYLEFYSVFQSKLPGVIHTLSGFMPYSLCLYLATFPRKKQTFIPLALFWISALPSLIVGVRNPIVLNSIFIFLYYFIRDLLYDKEKWIGKFEKITLAVAIPIMTIFMFAYSFIRSEESVKILNPLKMIIEFFWGQGTTFTFVAQGYGYRLNLPVHEWGNYTFGGILDYLVYGRIGQMIFGTEALPYGNNLINAIESHNLSHNLSYVILKERYLNGQGVGSSYVFENYLDWGYMGVFLFSIILGMFLVLAVHLMKTNVLIRAIVLMCLTSIFFAPRAEATGWLNFIVTIQFWMCMGACYLGAFLCTKITWLQRLIPKKI